MTADGNTLNGQLVPGFRLRHRLLIPEVPINRIAWSPDGRILASLGADTIIRLWDAETGTIRDAKEGGSIRTYDLAWSPDGQILCWGTAHSSVWFWNLRTNQLSEMRGAHSGDVTSIAWSPDGQTLVTGGADSVLRFWDPETHEDWQELDLRFVSGGIMSLEWSPNSQKVAVASLGGNVTLLEVQSGSTQHKLLGRVGVIVDNYSLAWSPDGQVLAVGANDNSVWILHQEDLSLFTVLEAHTSPIVAVSFSYDGKLLASKSKDNTIRLWRCDLWEEVMVYQDPTSHWWPPGLAFHPTAPVLAAVSDRDTAISVWDIDENSLLSGSFVTPPTHFRNAKVVLVGDSGVGKSGLGLVLTGQEYQPTDSTHGRRVWTLGSHNAILDNGHAEVREILLWDLAGQPGYRVFHQQSLNDVAVALILFDARSEVDPFAGVPYWARALDNSASGSSLIKFLVASRGDRGGPVVSKERIDEIRERYGFGGFFETSAKQGIGIQELRQAIHEVIPWNQLPQVTAPSLFHDMKTFIVSEKEAGKVLAPSKAILERFRVTDSISISEASEQAFETCLGRIETAGLVRRLNFGNLVLLQPEMLDDYGAWLAQAARSEPDGLGFILERNARSGNFPMDHGRILRDNPDEQVLLTATIEDLLDRGIVLRQATEEGEMLVFPSELRTDMPDFSGEYIESVYFRFTGPVNSIYARLVVSLAYTPAFKKDRFFKNAAIFRSTGDEACGFSMVYPEPMDDTIGRLSVFFDPNTTRTTKLLFLRYINRRIEELAFAGSIMRERVYQCDCGYIIPNDAIELRRARGERTAICPNCNLHPAIDTLAEESAEGDPAVAVQRQHSVEQLERESRLTIISERERGSEFHVFLCHNSKDKPTVRQLNQVLREQGILGWVDEEGILSGQFVPQLEKVIEEAPSVAVIMGSHGVGRWQEQEYYAFLQRYVEFRQESGRKRLEIIPVLLPEAPDEIETPLFLRGFSRIDFRGKAALENREEIQRLVRAILSST